jgi:hypothetical protein
MMPLSGSQGLLFNYFNNFSCDLREAPMEEAGILIDFLAYPPVTTLSDIYAPLSAF